MAGFQINLSLSIPYLYICFMAGNTTGTLFKLTSFGESHGSYIGGVIDGCPPGILIDEEFIRHQVFRRKSGSSKWSSQRTEDDEVEFISGIFNGKTSGTPVAFIIRNKDAKPDDYEDLKKIYRPSHADYTYDAKYGIRDYRGGGRASARETLVRVIGGAIARQYLKKYDINVLAYVHQIGDVAIDKCHQEIDVEMIEKSELFCPHPDKTRQMLDLLNNIRLAGDSIGGSISCIIKGVAAGLGEPVFDRLEADLAKAMLNINASKGFEIGKGFESASMKGSEFNDPFISDKGIIKTATNNSGGVLGGISNGMDICFKIAFKPVPTINKMQKTISSNGDEVVLNAGGRHDVCLVPRAVPVVEAMAALVVADHMMRNKAIK